MGFYSYIFVYCNNCRYDGRGHLLDLSEYDADLFNEKIERLSDEERNIEALCDEERYLELQADYLERTMYAGKLTCIRRPTNITFSYK